MRVSVFTVRCLVAFSKCCLLQLSGTTIVHCCRFLSAAGCIKSFCFISETRKHSSIEANRKLSTRTNHNSILYKIEREYCVDIFVLLFCLLCVVCLLFLIYFVFLILFSQWNDWIHKKYWNNKYITENGVLPLRIKLLSTFFTRKQFCYISNVWITAFSLSHKRTGIKRER